MKLRRKILQVITHFSLGGAEQVALRLATGLSDRHDFYVFAVRKAKENSVGQDMKSELSSRDIPFEEGSSFNIKRGGILQASWRLLSIIRRWQPNVIHLHTEIPEATFACASALMPSLLSVPVLRTVHNSVLWPEIEGIGRLTEKRLKNATFAAVSKAAEEAIQSTRAKLGLTQLDEEKLWLIYNGIPKSSAKVYTAASPSQPIKLLFAGRLEKQKGADLLPAIMTELLHRNSVALELTVAGKGSLWRKLKGWQATSEKSLTVNLLPPIPNLRHTISAYDLCIMPSRFEGLGLLAIEALLAGVPVVATRAKGLDEIFPPDYPWLAEPGNPGAFAAVLAQALSQRPSWPEVIQKTLPFINAHFGLATMLARYCSLYQAMSES